MAINNVSIGDIATRSKFNEIISALNKIGISWVNFNGSTAIIRDSSSDITSITKLGSGDYEVNFASPKSNSNYTIIGNCTATAGNDTGFVLLINQLNNKFRIHCRNDDGTIGDSNIVSMIINTSE
jgi:hypothetical protein